MNRVTLVKHLVQVVGLEMWGRKVEHRKIEKRQNKAVFKILYKLIIAGIISVLCIKASYVALITLSNYFIGWTKKIKRKTPKFKFRRRLSK